MNERDEMESKLWHKLVDMTAKRNWTVADMYTRSALLDLYVEWFTPWGSAEDRARVIHGLQIATVLDNSDSSADAEEES